MTLRLRGSVSRQSKKPSWRLSQGVPNPRPSAEMWRGGGAQKTTEEGLPDQRWGNENARVTGATQVTPAGPQTDPRPSGPGVHEGPRLSGPHMCVLSGAAGVPGEFRVLGSHSGVVRQEDDCSGAGGGRGGGAAMLQRKGSRWCAGPGRSWWGWPGQVSGVAGRRERKEAPAGLSDCWHTIRWILETLHWRCFTSPWEQKALAEPDPYLLFLRSGKNTGNVHLHWGRTCNISIRVST